MFEFLLGAFCFLAAVTVIGHGLWVGIRWVFATLNGDTSHPNSCHRCSLPVQGPFCQACGWPGPIASRASRAAPALEALGRQVSRLGELGVLDPQAIESLTHTIGTEHDRAIAAENAQQAERAAARTPVWRPVAPAVTPSTEPPADDVIVAEVATEEPSGHVGPARPDVLGKRDPFADRAAATSPAYEPSLVERAAAYQAHRAEATPAHRAPTPAPPRRSWTDWLAGFLEDSNIRWGELVAGMLIVCCSIALVISFWSQIAALPWLKFLLFNGLTAALFGVGFYSEYRLRLRMTSQGLLTIGAMLVPLNFLAIAAFSDVPQGTGLLTIVGEVLSAGLFAGLLFYAGRVLVRRDEAWLTAGIMIPALAQLLVRRFVQPGASLQVLSAVAAPCVGSYLLSNFWHLRQANRTLVLSERQVNALFRFLGLTSFAVALPLALLAAKTGNPMGALRQMPLLFVFLGVAPLTVGLSIWQKLAGRGLAGLRTAGTSLAVAGAGLSLAGLVLGWPEPRAMVPAALAEFLVFSWIAWRYRLPQAHLLAAACLALGYVCLVQLASGTITWTGNDPLNLARALLSGSSGLLLAPLVLAYAGATFLAVRHQSDAQHTLLGAAVALGIVSTVLVSWFSAGVQGDPFGAAWIYLLYGAGMLAVAARHTSVAPAWAAAGLLLATVVQGIVFHYGDVWNLNSAPLAALLVYATLTSALALAVSRLGLARTNSGLPGVLWQAGLAVSLIAAGWLTVMTPTTAVVFAAMHWAWLTALWLLMAFATGWLPVWTLFQAGLTVTVAYAGLPGGRAAGLVRNDAQRVARSAGLANRGCDVGRTELSVGWRKSRRRLARHAPHPRTVALALAPVGPSADGIAGGSGRGAGQLCRAAWRVARTLAAFGRAAGARSSLD